MFLKLEGRSCLVVGAGNIAESKIRSLLVAGATVRVVAPHARKSVTDWARAGVILWDARPFEPRDLEGIFLVIAAIASTELNADIGEAAPNSNWFTFRKRNGYKFRLSAKNIASGGMYPDVETKRPVTLPRDFGFCDSAWKRLVILSDGSIQPCCLDLKGTLAYTAPDELETKTLHELWHNDSRIAAIREEALRGQVNHPTCQKCLDRLPSREFYTAFAEKFANVDSLSSAPDAQKSRVRPASA